MTSPDLERIKDGYIITIHDTTFKIDLRYGQIYLVKWRSYVINHAIIFFDPKNNRNYQIKKCTIVGEKGIAFGDGIEIEIILKSNYITLQAKVENGTVGFMWAVVPTKFTRAGGILRDTDTKYTNSYHFGDINHVPQLSQEIPLPYIVHDDLINNITVISRHSESAKFHSFSVNDQNYMNCIVESHKICIEMHNDISLPEICSRLESNLETKTYNEHKIDIMSKKYSSVYVHHNQYIFWNDIEKLLYYGITAEVESPSTKHIGECYDICRTTQKMLSDHNIESIVLGSVAMNLHSCPSKINDIDISVKNQKEYQRAIKIMENKCKIVDDDGIRCYMMANDKIISLCYYKASPHNYIDASQEYIQGIRTCRKEDLVSCRLWMDWFMNKKFDNYKVMEEKNDRRLFNMLISEQFSPFIANENIDIIKEYKIRGPKLIQVLSKFKGRKLSNVTVNTRSKCHTAIYETDNYLLIPIINIGSAKQILIDIISYSIENAIFYDGRSDTICEFHEGFHCTSITVKVKDFGLLVCKK